MLKSKREEKHNCFNAITQRAPETAEASSKSTLMIE